MKLIVGLGNPGRSYAKHRHNVGFWVVDEVAGRYNINVGKKAFGAKIGIGEIEKEPVVLAKPQKFMNLSGMVVSPLLGYYRCSLKELIVVHDDIDLAVGRLKFAIGSGHGGHNGVKSIVEELGSTDFYRVRVGVGRPPEGIDPADYVLHRFAKEETLLIEKAVADAAQAIGILIAEGLAAVQQKYH
jgi:PTH1 family peptidyl-tRNA hydrolase